MSNSASRLISDESGLVSSTSKLKRLELNWIGNLFLLPSCKSLIESIKSNCPKFHDEYWSLNISVTVNSNSVTKLLKPFAVTKPTGLNTSPTLKLYPLFSNTKLLTTNNVDPIPTDVLAAPIVTLTDAPVPVSVVAPIPLLDTPVIGRLLYEGSGILITGSV